MSAATPLNEGPSFGRLWTPEEAAQYLNVDVWFVYRHSHEMGVRKVGRLNRYAPEDVIAFSKKSDKK